MGSSVQAGAFEIQSQVMGELQAARQRQVVTADDRCWPEMLASITVKAAIAFLG
jgi:hypothetical protein